MIRRTLSICALAVCTLAPAVSPAFPLFGKSDAAQAKVKMVKLTLKNRTAAPMELVIEDKPITIAAGGEYALNAPEGTKVYDADRTTVKVTVTRDLAGATTSFR